MSISSILAVRLGGRNKKKESGSHTGAGINAIQHDPPVAFKSVDQLKTKLVGVPEPESEKNKEKENDKNEDDGINAINVKKLLSESNANKRLPFDSDPDAATLIQKLAHKMAYEDDGRMWTKLLGMVDSIFVRNELKAAEGNIQRKLNLSLRLRCLI